jgi:hypothetical protein
VALYGEARHVMWSRVRLALKRVHVAPCRNRHTDSVEQASSASTA